METEMKRGRKGEKEEGNKCFKLWEGFSLLSWIDQRMNLFCQNPLHSTPLHRHETWQSRCRSLTQLLINIHSSKKQINLQKWNRYRLIRYIWGECICTCPPSPSSLCGQKSAASQLWLMFYLSSQHSTWVYCLFDLFSKWKILFVY